LVLDLDETLIHLECDEEENENSGDDNQEQNEDGVYYLIRPGAIKFLNELSKYYEIVIFTAAMPDVSIIKFLNHSYISMLIG
jgi:TFIIF-interacting CTD phosphatase-like protein